MRKKCKECKKMHRELYKTKDGRRLCYFCAYKINGHRPVGALSRNPNNKILLMRVENEK